MWHLGNISARQGLLVEARSNFVSLAERRRARGDTRGEAEVRIRLGDLDGADLETRLAGARARVELGDPKAAVERLKQYAADLQEKGKDDDALQLLTEAAKIDPEDMSLRRLLVQAYHRARRFRRGVPVRDDAPKSCGIWRQSCSGLAAKTKASTCLRPRLTPIRPNAPIRMELVKRLVTRGDMAGRAHAAHAGSRRQRSGAAVAAR